MKLVPLDIKQKEFSVNFRGYSKVEVLDFKEDIASVVEELITENNKLKGETISLKEELSIYQSIETTLKQTMITAQQIKDDMHRSSKKEYDLTIAEAELEANRIISKSREQVIAYQTEIEELRRQKHIFQNELENLLNSHLNLLKTFHSKE
jgi:cell division initiation protein